MSTYNRKRKYYQRKYQKTKYQIPNVLVPDELVMKVKRNWVITTARGVNRIILPINGLQKGDVEEYFNLSKNMAKFKQIEFLSGKVSIYPRPHYRTVRDRNIELVNDTMVGYFTARQWVDQDLELQNELVIPKQESYITMWTESAETPGYGIKLLKNAYCDNRSKFGFKGSKKDWKTLKANPTSFQENLPFDGTANDYVPKNIKLLYLDYTELVGNELDQTDGSAMIFLISHSLLVRFKGRLEL
ncbi:hypothetical protein [Circo-like virus-Brazil hs1]|uniref:hypothetical protein n=1 Tax=Circo-like virus-Brazil hs1 TaxID=1346815 RepID=UPI0003B0822B|nr:hypothetical protein [Circo-like virus-Brazil hs1]AGO61977.1 hypothetical protein [Circo-like virus-Brazil hs1]